MLLGIGIDLCNKNRIAKICKKYHKKFEAKLGLNNASVDIIAKYWCALEAFSKASTLGIAKCGLNSIKIEYQPSRKPYLVVNKSTKNKIKKLFQTQFQTHLSISHEDEYITCIVILEQI